MSRSPARSDGVVPAVPDAAFPDGEASDLELMGQVRQGDADALDRLLKRYWQPLLKFAAQIVGCGDAAEDIVQETFFRVWRTREHWRPSGSVRSYLYHITRNLALNERRWLKLRASWRSSERHLPTPGPTPAQDLEASELRAAADDAIAALPKRRREVFLLARHHDMSYREIAEIMGISERTVANQLSRAMAAMRKVLGTILEG